MTPQVRRLQRVRVRFRQAGRDVEGSFDVVDTTPPWLEFDRVEAAAVPDVDTIVDFDVDGASFRATVQRRDGDGFTILRPVFIELESDERGFDMSSHGSLEVDLDRW